MNCRRAQRAISLRRDGGLRPSAAGKLDAHLATCPDCRAFGAKLDAVGAQLRAQTAPAGPTPEAAWAGVQRAIRLQEGGWARGALWEAAPWLRWASASALFLLVAGGGLMLHGQFGGRRPGLAPATEVLRVTTELAGASTMVYEDHDTGWTVVWVMPAEDGNHARM